MAAKKLLLIGSTHGSVHLKNYYLLIKDYFDEVFAVTTTEIDYCRYEVLNFSVKNPLKSRKTVKRLRRIIDDENPDIIHVHQANSCAYLSAKAINGSKPMVLTTWGSDVLRMPDRGTIYKKMVQYSLKAADYITADASYMAEVISDLGCKTEVTIANFGIDYDGAELPQKENIIYSNRMHYPLYHIDQIIRAFGEFHKGNEDWKLIVAADGDQKSQLEELAKEILSEGSFEFIGFVDRDENKRQYLRASVWISIPDSDGTSISLLEAMAYGCIPVVSDLAANNEWVSHSQNGLIVKDSLSDMMQKAVGMDIANVQKLNREIVNARATKEVNRKIFYGIYDQILPR